MIITKELNGLIEAELGAHQCRLTECALCGLRNHVLAAYVPADGAPERSLRLAANVATQCPVLLYGLCRSCSIHHMEHPIDVARIVEHNTRFVLIDGHIDVTCSSKDPLQ